MSVRCWNCGQKINGQPYRSWQTTSYSQRGYSGLGLRSGRIYVGGSSGQRQSRVSLCAQCDTVLNPPPYGLSGFLSDIRDVVSEEWDSLNPKLRTAIGGVAFVGSLALMMIFG